MFLMYKILFDVDYNSKDTIQQYVADTCFTFAHWKFIEKLISKEFDLNEIVGIDTELLSSIILPGCKTLLHLISLDSVNLNYLLNDFSNDNFDIPFMMDKKHKTPLHKAVKKQDIKCCNIFITYLSKKPLLNHSRLIVDIIP